MDARESPFRRHLNSQHTRAGPERWQSTDPLHLFAATELVSSCLHGGATPPGIGSRSSASGCSTSARQAKPDTRAAAQTSSSGNERLHPAESCALVRVKALLHLPSP